MIPFFHNYIYITISISIYIWNSYSITVSIYKMEKILKVYVLNVNNGYFKVVEISVAFIFIFASVCSSFSTRIIHYLYNRSKNEILKYCMYFPPFLALANCFKKLRYY